MTEEQIKNVATGIIRVLRTREGVYEKWVEAGKTHDPAKLGAWVRETMGLESAPTWNEIMAMDNYMAEHLAEDVAAFLEKRGTDGPVIVAICGEQQQMLESA